MASAQELALMADRRRVDPSISICMDDVRYLSVRDVLQSERPEELRKEYGIDASTILEIVGYRSRKRVQKEGQ